MRLDQFTVKAQEAIVAAQTAAEKSDHPEVTTEHLLQALLAQEGGVVPSALGKLGANIGGDRPPTSRRRSPPCPAPRARATHVSPRLDAVLKQALREAGGAEGRVRLHRAPAARAAREQDARRRGARSAHGVTRDALLKVLREIRGNQRVTDPQRRGALPGAREVRPRPHRARAQGQARPRHRPRRRGAPRDAGALPPHQEQPGAHRRAGRGQDRHRRGPGPAHRRGRRARVAQEQARGRARPRRAHRGRQVPRRVRGPPEGRAQGGHGVRGRDHPLHRRAAHGRRRGRRRGRDGRLQHAQARARARRAALRRRHDAQRVPEAHREGRRPRAALPARLRGRAERSRRRSRSCAA